MPWSPVPSLDRAWHSALDRRTFPLTVDACLQSDMATRDSPLQVSSPQLVAINSPPTLHAMPSTRRVLALALLALAFAAPSTAQSSSASTSTGACSAAPSTLSTTCGGLCDSGQSCVTFNASDSCTSCVTSSEDACQYLCLATEGQNDSVVANVGYFVLLVPFGEYESDREIAESAEDPLYAEKVASLSDNTSEFAHVSNDILKSIAPLELLSTTGLLIISGGSTYDMSLRSKVVELDLSSTMLTSQTQLKGADLRNVNLETAIVNIPEIFPSSMYALGLINGLLSTFPSHLGNMSNLQYLYISLNYVSMVNASDGIDQLLYLDMQYNNVTSFEGNFPLLETLDLRNNNLTAIPDVIYTYSNLQTLYMKYNLLETPTYTTAQANFLSALTEFDLTRDDFANEANCDTSSKRVIHSLTVCIVEDAEVSSSSGSTATSDGSSGGSSSSTTVIIVAVVVGLVVLIGIVIGTIWWRKRRNAGATPDYTTSTAPSGQSTLGKAPIVTSVWTDQELLRFQVRLDDIEDIRLLGSGAYGVVYLVRYRNSQLLASKRLRAETATRDNVQKFIAEIKLVAELEHPNIVQFVGAAWSIEANLQALFEFMENGDLRMFLTESNTPRHWTKVKLQLTIDIIEALVYVHSFQPPLIHRDLKSRNVLISADMEAKLTDFGVSRYQSVQETMTIGVGTGRWLAPEVINGSNDYGPAADIYSFGCVLSELDTHTIPYDGMTGDNGNPLNDMTLLHMVASGVLRPTFTHMCPPTVLELAQLCMNQDPAKRPSAVEIAYVLRSLPKEMFA